MGEGVSTKRASTILVNPIVEPWTRRELQAALREAGWHRVEGSPGRVYVSPDDPTVIFNLDEYRRGIGVLWQYFAARRELPATTRSPY